MTTTLPPAPAREKVLDTFLEMVRIDSPSGGEEQFCAYLAARMKGLGLEYTVDAAGNLIVEVPKHRCHHDDLLVFSGHMDVVPPCHGIVPKVVGEGDEQLVVSDNTTVLGADDKAALAPMVEALIYALENNWPRPRLRLIFTVREETMLGGAKDLADEHIADASFAVIFDHTGKQGTIIEQTPTYIDYTIHCHGKSVHAGIMPEQGVNAIVLAARIADKLHYGRVNENTTANLGFLKGGKATNVVPDLCTLRGEIRSLEAKSLEAEIRHIEQVVDEERAKMPGASVDFDYNYEFFAYTIDKTSVPVRRVVAAVEQAGLTPHFNPSNGGSDNNVFVHRGLKGVTMGASFIDPHALTERVKVVEMERCARLVLCLMERFAAEPFAP